MSDTIRTGRWSRIAWGAVLLPLTAALAFSLVWSIAFDPLAGLFILPMCLYGAIPLFGIQSVVYSFLMEFAVWRVAGTRWLATFVSAMLGLIGAGLVCGVEEDFRPNFLFAGIAAGLVTGLVLRVLRRRSELADAAVPPSPTSDVAPSAECFGACSVEDGVPH